MWVSELNTISLDFVNDAFDDGLSLTPRFRVVSTRMGAEERGSLNPFTNGKNTAVQT